MRITKTKGCFWCGFITQSLFAVAFIAIGAFFGPITDYVIDSQVKGQVYLTKENKGNWGEIPGDHNLHVTRNISLFNFTNPEEVWRGTATPKFQTTPELTFKEIQQVENITMSDNKEFIAFDQTLSMEEDMQDEQLRSWLDRTVSIPNLAALGAWQTIKNYNASSVAYSTFAGVMTALQRDDTLIYAASSTAVWYVLVKDKETAYIEFFNKAQNLRDETKERLWSDPNFGFNSSNAMKPWIKAAYLGITSNDAIMLKNHFQLTMGQMLQLLNVLIKEVDAIRDTLVSNFSCKKTGCTSKELLALQWATQGVSNDPPIATIPANPSLCQLNSTVFGYPEFSYYKSEVFMKKEEIVNSSDFSKYKDAGINLETAKKLTAISLDPKNPVKDEDTLNHKYNMKVLFDHGSKYDETEDLNLLLPIVERFGVDDVYVARILWAYLKYLVSDFATNGFNLTSGAKGTIAEMQHEEVWDKYHDEIHIFVKSRMLKNTLDKDEISCKKLIKNSSPMTSDQTLDQFCDGENDKITHELMKDLVDYCFWQNPEKFQKYNMAKYGFTGPQIKLLCGNEAVNSNNEPYFPSDPTKRMFEQYLQQINREMSSSYKCVQASHCTRREVIAQQWASSGITTMPNPILDLPITDSIVDWITEDNMKGYRFEIPAFAKIYNITAPIISLENALKLVNFDVMLSPLSTGKAIAEYSINGNNTWSAETFFFPDGKVFDEYTKYAIVDGFFNGFTLNMSIRDTIFGFHNEPLQKLKDHPPNLGGDPTVDSNPIMLKLHETLHQTRFTGFSDEKMNGQFASWNNYTYVTFNQSTFNGNETYIDYVSPWGDKVPIKGGDNLMGPNLSENSVPTIFQSDFYRTFDFNYVKDCKYSDGNLSAKRYKIDNKAFRAGSVDFNNNKFYQYVYDGAFNQTSIFRAPVFLTKRYFLDANQSLYDKIEMYDQNMQVLNKSNDDDIIVDIQDRTGVPLHADVYIQLSIDVPQDEQFNSKGNTLYPIFYLRRSLTLNEEQIQDLFGPLMLIQNHGLLIRIIVLCIGGLFLLGCIMFFICVRRRIEKEDEEYWSAVITERNTRGGTQVFDRDFVKQNLSETCDDRAEKLLDINLKNKKVAEK